MIGISGWVGETTDWLLRTGKQDCCDVRKANWNEEEITLVIKMAREVFEEEWPPAFQCICLCEGLGLCELISHISCLSSCWLLYRLLQEETLGTWVKTFQAIFWDPVRVTLAAWGLAVIVPFWCLSCAQQNFIASIRETAPLSVAIKGWNNERARRGKYKIDLNVFS